MKILIFSDTHLHDVFEEKKYEFLKKIITKADRVIINGDFWDVSLCTFSDFVNSSWSKLFPLLKKKKTVYIYGNHDREVYVDKRVFLFSDIQADEFVLKKKKVTYHIEHGNRLDEFLMKLDNFLFMHRRIFRSARPLFRHLKKVERAVLRTFGKSLLKYLFQKHNDKLKLLIKDKASDKQLFVFGHTHMAEVDSKAGFINSGIIQHGLAQYLTIDETGFKHREEWYE